MGKQSKTDWKKLDEMKDEDIDTSDIEALDDDFFSRAELRLPPKQAVTIRLDADVLEWFKGKGKGYQTRINKLLRIYMESQERAQRSKKRQALLVVPSRQSFACRPDRSGGSSP